MGTRIKYVIFGTEWGYFGLAGTERGLVRSVLPVRDEKRAKLRLLKGLNQEECKYSRDYLKGVQRDVSAYYKGKYVNFDVKICYEGITEFQISVLRAYNWLPQSDLR
jgi:hypothetical protein